MGASALAQGASPHPTGCERLGGGPGEGTPKVPPGPEPVEGPGSCSRVGERQSSWVDLPGRPAESGVTKKGGLPFLDCLVPTMCKGFSLATRGAPSTTSPSSPTPGLGGAGGGSSLSSSPLCSMACSKAPVPSGMSRPSPSRLHRVHSCSALCGPGPRPGRHQRDGSVARTSTEGSSLRTEASTCSRWSPPTRASPRGSTRTR